MNNPRSSLLQYSFDRCIVSRLTPIQCLIIRYRLVKGKGSYTCIYIRILLFTLITRSLNKRTRAASRTHFSLYTPPSRSLSLSLSLSLSSTNVVRYLRDCSYTHIVNKNSHSSEDHQLIGSKCVRVYVCHLIRTCRLLFFVYCCRCRRRRKLDHGDIYVCHH